MSGSVETFQIAADAAEVYESKFVPAIFGEWAPHLVEAASRAGARHLVYISVVGADRIPIASGIDRAMFGYFGSKLAAERAVTDSGLPWTTLRDPVP